MQYIVSKKVRGCLFCHKLSQTNDEKNYILYRSKKAFVMLNIFPYTNGHLMVVVNRHINAFEKLSSDELHDMLKLTLLSITVLKKTLHPGGFNIGINLGKCSGAGISGHLHIHIVPRWLGDTNFMPVLANTKVIPESLHQTYVKLKQKWHKLKL